MLYVDGHAKEAIEFYCHALDLTKTKVIDAADPKFKSDDPKYKGKIVYSKLDSHDGTSISVVDIVDKETCGKSGNTLHIAISHCSAETQKCVYDKLCQGGKVIHPLGKSIWDSQYFSVQDN
eukprot:gene8428-9914_t